MTVSARRPVTALDKVKTAVRFDNVRKWGRAALFAAGTAAAVCTAACLLKRIKAVMQNAVSPSGETAFLHKKKSVRLITKAMLSEPLYIS
ncbi:MAG: hypothetical protein ACLUIQ_03630 [Dialister invisus]